MVAAVADNGVIGRDGDMPWQLSSDLRRFKAITMGKPVVMGRKTFDSIGKPLPGRPNIVISRSAAAIDGAIVTPGLDAALEKAASLIEGDTTEICVIGGGEIYRQALERADRLEITHVEGRVDGDTVFPAIDPDVWTLESEERVCAGERDSHDMRFAVYRRTA
ncbi:dihydrofolate reductase [Pseudohoeflea suaedae]|uniref:dihydrofolate reductase n=1 Tax=Pseudohoeflea suaedae TaxID=877384 RepID=UPI0024528E72|nr:dihydrofolate reductase [Pseudohoeflea suaedae]